MAGQNARTIFLKAIELRSDAERAALLQAACGESTPLRAEVESLLAAHQQPGDLLESDKTGETPTVSLAPSRHPGNRVGPYKLLQQIGEGGMGVVFMAEQEEPISRRVALKIIKPGMDTRQVIARFAAERQALALMDHPNIAKVFDAGETDTGSPYFVMELVPGVPITQYCDRQRLTPRQRLELFVPVCQAVQHAHQKGIIHRDIKPSNVLVASYDGQATPKVIDFGVAKATEATLAERTLFTEFGAVVGTLEYMSPEQAEISPLDIDTRSDIYSLGVLLYELLTGTTPLERKRLKESALLEVLRAIREEDPPRPSMRLSTAEGLPALAANRGLEPTKLTRLVRGDLDWIVMMALEKNRNRRYESANDFAADVQRYLGNEPVQARPPSAGYRLERFARRHKTSLTMAAAVAAVLVLATVVSTRQAIIATQAQGLAAAGFEAERKARQEADTAREEAVRNQTHAQHRLFEARWAEARARQFSRRIGQRYDGLEALTEAARLSRELGLGEEIRDQLRDDAIAGLALPDLRLVKQWKGAPAGTMSLGFDADLEHYVRSDPTGNHRIRGIADDRELALLPSDPEGRDPKADLIRFSPDGALLAVLHRGPLHAAKTNFRVWDWRRGQVAFEPPFELGHEPFAFHPDSGSLALIQDNGFLYLYDVRDWHEVWHVQADSAIRAVSFHPDGAKLAVADPARNEIQIRRSDTGDLLQTISNPKGCAATIWHPDGIHLAVATHQRSVSLYDTSSRNEPIVLGGHESDAVRVSFDPASGLLLSWSWDERIRLWDPWTRRERLRFIGWGGWFHRDGSRLITQSGQRLNYWEMASGREYRSLPKSRRSAQSWEGDMSRDGRLLALATSAGVHLWDLSREQELAFLDNPGTYDVKFHPSGAALYTSGLYGVNAWDIGLERDTWKISHAHSLLVGNESWRMGLDREGRFLAVAVPGGDGGGGGHLFDLQDRSRVLPPLRHTAAAASRISPDGRWIATGVHLGSGVKVWDAATGELAHEFESDQHKTRAVFSPDGRLLVTIAGDGYRIWRAGTWEPVAQVLREEQVEMALSAAFSMDSRVLATMLSHSVICLYDATSWRPLARLQSPDTDAVELIGFTPDGARLAVSSKDGNVHLWDLRLIREQLRAIGLDWDQPSFPAGDPPAESAFVRAEVDLGDVGGVVRAREHIKRGSEFVRKGRHAEALAEYTRAVEHDRMTTLALNNLAWHLATGPDPQYRDPERAVELARAAIDRAPEHGDSWNTLGAAHYRAGNWDAAVRALEKSVELRNGGDAFDWFFLSMAHWRLGDQEQARTWYDRAVQWTAKKLPEDEELRRFHAEASELLMITGVTEDWAWKSTASRPAPAR